MAQGRFAAASMALAALAAGGCHYVPFSEGREEAFQRSFKCPADGDHPARYRAIALRHGLDFNENRMSQEMHLAGGELGPSEFLFQRIGEDVKISLWVQPEAEPTAEEARIFDEMAAAFADCRPNDLGPHIRRAS